MFVSIIEKFMRAQFIKLTITNLQEENIREEHDRSERLLINTFPKSVITHVNSNEPIYETVPYASVLFSDIVSFTDWSSKITAEEIVSTLGLLFYEWDGLCEPLGVEKVKTIGDAYVACCGVTDKLEDHPKRIAEMALQMLETLEQLNRKFYWNLHIRIGLSVGAVTSGLLGFKKKTFELFGPTVADAQLMESSGVPDKVHISQAMADALKDDYILIKRQDQVKVI